MAIVKAFRGVRYDLSKAGTDLGQLACPPYDIVSPARQRVLHERHPDNFIHVDFGLPEADDVPGQEDIYTRAAALWQAWLTSGVVKEDDTPRFYLYRQRFAATVGGVDARFSRLGLVASVHAEDFGGRILR